MATGGFEAVPGLTYLPGYLAPAEQSRLLAIIDGLSWREDLKRRVQHYGYRYDYTRKTVDYDMLLGPLPSWAAELAENLRRNGHTTHLLNQLIVNEYLPSQGIAPHVDCVTCFADPVLSLSLGSSCVMSLTHPHRGDHFTILLEPGSLLVMSDEARYQWKHSIPARKIDVEAGRRVPRGRRVSLTFRTVLISPDARATPALDARTNLSSRPHPSTTRRSLRNRA